MEQLHGKTEEEIYTAMKNYIENGFIAEKFDPEKYNNEILEKIEKIFD